MLAALTAACIAHVAGIYAEPVTALDALLRIEGGQVGTVSRDANGTADLGPYQVNTSWVSFFAKAWHRAPDETYYLIRDHGCANALAAGAVLRAALDEAHGNIGVAIGYYHSHTPERAATYRQHFIAALRKVLQHGEQN